MFIKVFRIISECTERIFLSNYSKVNIFFWLVSSPVLFFPYPNFWSCVSLKALLSSQCQGESDRARSSRGHPCHYSKVQSPDKFTYAWSNTVTLLLLQAYIRYLSILEATYDLYFVILIHIYYCFVNMFCIYSTPTTNIHLQSLVYVKVGWIIKLLALAAITGPPLLLIVNTLMWGRWRLSDMTP
jgi:hypothetical protein